MEKPPQPPAAGWIDSDHRSLYAVCMPDSTINNNITMAEGSTENKEIMLHCAGCGVKEDGDIKLKKCTASAIWCNIVVSNVKGSTGRSIKRSARSGHLSYETRFYSSSLRTPILETVPSAVCRYRWMYRNLLCIHVVATGSAADAVMPMQSERKRGDSGTNAHSVVIQYQNRGKNIESII